MNDDEYARPLFIAIAVPSHVKTVLAALPHKDIDAKRWNHVDDFHMTLCFLGACPKEQYDDIHGVLQQVKARKLSMVLEGLNCFEQNKQPILYADAMNKKKVMSLRADVLDKLVPLGFDFGGKPFTPHITVARLRNLKGLDSYIKRHHRQVKAQWQATEFHLMRSGAGVSNGRCYEILQTYTLK